mgnify:CR=1 FL=1
MSLRMAATIAMQEPCRSSFLSQVMEMKPILFRIIFLLGCTVVLSYVTFSQTSDRVLDEEYKVYSAFINQVYITEANGAWYTITGTKATTYSHIDKIGQVVIYSRIAPETTNGDSKFRNASYRNQIPDELFQDFLKRNEKYYELSDEFRTDLKHHLVSPDEVNKLAARAEQRATTYAVEFLKLYPKAPGSIGFFRVAFDAQRKTALLGTAIWKIRDPNISSSPFPAYQLVTLRKHRGGWRVEKILPGEDSLRVSLRNCTRQLKHHWLPLGSASLEVVGREENKCRVREFHETEGGWTTTDCLLPISLNELRVAGLDTFSYSLDLSRHCEKPKRGNIFFDRISVGFADLETDHSENESS